MYLIKLIRKSGSWSTERSVNSRPEMILSSHAAFCPLIKKERNQRANLTRMIYNGRSKVRGKDRRETWLHALALLWPV